MGIPLLETVDKYSGLFGDDTDTSDYEQVCRRPDPFREDISRLLIPPSLCGVTANMHFLPSPL